MKKLIYINKDKPYEISPLPRKIDLEEVKLIESFTEAIREATRVPCEWYILNGEFIKRIIRTDL